MSWRDPYSAIHSELSREMWNCLSSISVQRGSKLLDFGCGPLRRYEALVNEMGFRYLGADLPSSAWADVIIEDEGLPSVGDQEIDIVMSNQVLEHVECPKRYLREANRVLKPGGHLVLSTHGYWTYHPGPEDNWRWTGAGLRKLLACEEFQIIRFQGVIGGVGAGLQIIQNTLEGKLRKRLRPLLTVPFQALISLVKDVGDLRNDAIDFVVVAKKASQ